MKTVKNVLAVGAGSLLALSGATGVAMAAMQDGTTADAPVAKEQASQVSQETDIVKTDVVVGEFSFTQTEINSLEDIARNIAEGAKFLCGAKTALAMGENEGEWSVAIDGAVDNPVSMTLAEMDEKVGSQKVLMGCSCAGNPIDGRASVNALAKGITLATLFEGVGVQDDVNTVVFTSADGYSVAVPWMYVQTQRGSIVFDVNGAPISDSIGGTNQLWLGSTPASYFVRDLAQITFEVRQTPPPSPTSDEAREALATLPHVGVLYGGDVR